jgi:hypothetical protein
LHYTEDSWQRKKGLEGNCPRRRSAGKRLLLLLLLFFIVYLSTYNSKHISNIIIYDEKLTGA